MKTTQFAVLPAGSGIRKQAAVLAILAVAVVAFTADLARAQPFKLEILFSPQAHDPNPQMKEVHLRPNTAQTLYMYVRNDGNKPVTATLELQAGGAVVPGGRSEVQLPPGFTSIALPKPPAPAPTEKPAPPAPLPAPLEVRLLDANNKAVAETARILVGRAREYVKVSRPVFETDKKDANNNRLTVEVEALPKFSGPECRVELVLRTDRIPGLAPSQKLDGRYAGPLVKPGDKLRLYAENLRFTKESGERNGWVYLTVDGYERAFTWKTTIGTDGLPATSDEVLDQLARLDVTSPTLPKEKTTIGLEVDNLRKEEKVELSFGRFSKDDKNEDKFEGDVRTFVGDRREEIVLGPPGPGGALQLKAIVEDWKRDFNTTSNFGEFKVRLRLLDATGKELEATNTKNAKPSTEIVESLMLDNNPPANVKFVKAPATLEQGKPLSLQATGTAESGIKEVIFYLGKPVDGKMPPNAPKVDARPDADRKNWSGVLAVPADKVGTIDVTAQFTSGVGLVASSDPLAVQITPAAPPVPKGKASISGKVG